MADQRPTDKPSTTDQILDLLLDALLERQKARQGGPSPRMGTEPLPSGVYTKPEPGSLERRPAQAAKPDEPAEQAKPAQTAKPAEPAERAKPAQAAKAAEPAERAKPVQVTEYAKRAQPAPPSPQLPGQEPVPGEKGWEPPARLPSIDMGKLILRLALLIAVLVIVVNIPVTQYGVSLARIMPESSSMIIRDGLVLKGSGPEIYVLQDDKLRWISSMDAFEHMRLTWEDVHVVEDAFLDKFEKGRPIHVLLKCQASPHIYRLENDQKRWIKDIDTFLAEGHVWEDVRFVTCPYLRDIPNGPPIPEDAGPPPEP